MFRDTSGFWYSPLKYVELIPAPSRVRHRKELLDLLCDKGCEPKYYSENAEQPEGAIGMPAPIARLADRQKEHQLALKIAQESSEHHRMLEENNHRSRLRQAQEQREAELMAASTSAAHYQTLEQQKHDLEIRRVRSAERMKRSEKAAWHALLYVYPGLSFGNKGCSLCNPLLSLAGATFRYNHVLALLTLYF
jgi:hypothetical protein